MRFRLLVVAALTAACFIAKPDVAKAQVELPVVRISSTTSPILFIDSCVAPTRVSVSSRGRFVLSRTGATDQKLTVTYHVTGSVQPTSGTAVFSVGSSTVDVALVPLTTTALFGGHVDVVALDGSGHSLGSPSHVSVLIGSVATTCTTRPTSTSTATSTSTTIFVAPKQLPRTGGSHTSAMLLSGVFVLLLGATLALVRRRPI